MPCVIGFIENCQVFLLHIIWFIIGFLKPMCIFLHDVCGLRSFVLHTMTRADLLTHQRLGPKSPGVTCHATSRFVRARPAPRPRICGAQPSTTLTYATPMKYVGALISLLVTRVSVLRAEATTSTAPARARTDSTW